MAAVFLVVFCRLGGLVRWGWCEEKQQRVRGERGDLPSLSRPTHPSTTGDLPSSNAATEERDSGAMWPGCWGGRPERGRRGGSRRGADQGDGEEEEERGVGRSVLLRWSVCLKARGWKGRRRGCLGEGAEKGQGSE
jgi:hypothetical protein